MYLLASLRRKLIELWKTAQEGGVIYSKYHTVVFSMYDMYVCMRPIEVTDLEYSGALQAARDVPDFPVHYRRRSRPWQEEKKKKNMTAQIV